MFFLYQDTDTLFHAVTNITNLKTITSVQIPVHCIATISTKLTGKCITATPFILEMEINEMVSIQNPQLNMMPTVHIGTIHIIQRYYCIIPIYITQHQVLLLLYQRKLNQDNNLRNGYVWTIML